MNYYDPKKFDQYPDGPSEDDYLKLAAQYGREWGSNNCYDGSPRKLSDREKEQLRRWYRPQRDYDDLDVKLGIVDANALDPIMAFLDTREPITNITAIEYTWKWQPTSNAATQTDPKRKDVRLGRLYTKTQNFHIWGFRTWQEFNSHCHITDKAYSRLLADQIKMTYATASSNVGDYLLCYWIAKDDKGITIPGFWSITADCLKPESPGRDCYFYANGKIDGRDNLILSKKNTIGVN